MTDARVYALQAGDDTLISNAVEIKMRAQSRAGHMLIEGKKAGQIAKQGGDRKSKDQNAKASILIRPTELGMSAHESAKYQQLAKVPEPVFEKAVEIVKKRDGVLTEAAVKREILPSKAEQQREIVGWPTIITDTSLCYFSTILSKCLPHEDSEWVEGNRKPSAPRRAHCSTMGNHWASRSSYSGQPHKPGGRFC